MSKASGPHGSDLSMCASSGFNSVQGCCSGSLASVHPQRRFVVPSPLKNMLSRFLARFYDYCFG